MKPWKIVILCSLCMFVGSMYQGCAVGEADADDDTDTTTPPKAATGGARTVIGPITFQHFEEVDADGYHRYLCDDYYIRKGKDVSSYNTLTDNPTASEYTTYCCPEGFSYVGFSTGVICLEDL